MSALRKYAGIDGCKDGWFCVFLDEEDNWSFSVFSDADTLAENLSDVRVALIDIPIGLTDFPPGDRQCDLAARKLLGGKRTSSVFPAPARQTLSARDYEEALKINRASVGKGLSQQAWAIVPKIREIDRLLSSNSTLHGLLRECHPELCFWALNGQSTMEHNKKKEEGKRERLNVLEKLFPQCTELFRQASATYLRKQVAHDDIIDAMVCVITAKYGYGQYITAPESPEYDSAGLLMEMVYCYLESEVTTNTFIRGEVVEEVEQFDQSSRNYRQLEEVLSWRLMTEILRRYPSRFKLIEGHPGGGQSDCLALLEYEDDWNFALDINRSGGSVHFYYSEFGPYPEWVQHMLSDDPKVFIDLICDTVGLPMCSSIPASTPETVTYRFITEFLTHSTGQLDVWQVRNGYEDTSGIEGGSIRQDFFEFFPTASERLEKHFENDVLEEPAYRFWFLVKNGAPQLCLETTGKAYRLDGGVINIVSDFKKHRRIWPLIVSAAIELLP